MGYLRDTGMPVLEKGTLLLGNDLYFLSPRGLEMCRRTEWDARALLNTRQSPAIPI